jgi:hypothetical protein
MVVISIEQLIKFNTLVFELLPHPWLRFQHL